jgi:hypothetical protein
LKKLLPKTKWDHLKFLAELIYDFMDWTPDVNVDDNEAIVVTMHSQTTGLESVVALPL